MASDENQRRAAIFEKTDGRCHICRRALVYENYGAVGRSGAWEIEHSKPRAKGGSNHLNNLYPACFSCNRSKGTTTTRTARKKNGHKAAPLSRQRKAKNGIVGGGVGMILCALLAPSLGLVGLIAATVVGYAAGSEIQPD